ncbi:MAG TPA: proton-conducting transporter membrane subunit [Kiritimatiellia bacterium]|nr:proton-conducting transporter membrane subunit [Kiritimatiellia bacterium]
MSSLVLILILLPLIGGLLQAALPFPRIRSAIILATAAATIGLAHLFLLRGIGADPIQIDAGFAWFERHAMLPVEILVLLILFTVAVKHRNVLTFLLVIGHALLLLGLHRAGHPEPLAQPLRFDSLALIMIMIVGVVGGGITIHATGYMRDHHRLHPAQPDRSPLFFFMILLFLSAMFGLVLSDSLPLMFLFWEITTLCSFFLISYERSKTAIKNAFLALNLNLLGGFGIGFAILHQTVHHGTPVLSTIASGAAPGALMAAVLIAVAGLAKSAQFPFSSWLLGAMVAPTPVSALLHSSAMVKAGVYLILRCGPVFEGTPAGFLIALIGAGTFLITSLIAVSQSNAKRVLAYSTIANLGLIIACAGIGTRQAMWAGMLLIIFHAVAKALLFLSVGTAEHKLGSRDIEDMHGLIICNPRLALAMLIGAAGMFLAPFGMLISKWAAIEALIQANPLLPILVAFGSAPTLFFWTKWMGKILACRPTTCPIERTVHLTEQAALGLLCCLTVGICALFPLVGSHVIEPFLGLYYTGQVQIGLRNAITMFIMLGVLALLPLSVVYRSRRERPVEPYLCAANVTGAGQFIGSAGAVHTVHLRNYYLADLIDERLLNRVGHLLGASILLVILAAATW